jgi:hypothetical protein
MFRKNKNIIFKANLDWEILEINIDFDKEKFKQEEKEVVVNEKNIRRHRNSRCGSRKNTK